MAKGKASKVLNNLYGSDVVQTKETKRKKKSVKLNAVTEKATQDVVIKDLTEIDKNKKYSISKNTDTDGYCLLVGGKNICQEHIEYAYANGFTISEYSQKLNDSGSVDDYIDDTEAPFYISTLADFNDESSATKGQILVYSEDGSEHYVTAKSIVEGEYFVYCGDGSDEDTQKITWKNERCNKSKKRTYSTGYNIGGLKKKDGRYYKIQGADWRDNGNHYCKIWYTEKNVGILRKENGDYYVQPTKLKSGFGKFLSFVTGSWLLDKILKELRGAFNLKGDFSLLKEYKDYYQEYHNLKNQVDDNLDRERELQLKLNAQFDSESGGNVIPVSYDNSKGFTQSLMKFMVAKMNEFCDNWNKFDYVYPKNTTKFLDITLCDVGAKQTFQLNVANGDWIGKTLGTIEELTGGNYVGSYPQNYVKIKLASGLVGLGINPVNGGNILSYKSGSITEDIMKNCKFIIVPKSQVQDFSNDTTTDSYSRKMQSNLNALYDATFGLYKEKGSNNEEVLNKFINPLINEYAYSKTDFLNAVKYINSDEDLWFECFLKLGWANNVDALNEFYQVMYYELYYEELQPMYEFDLTANQRISVLKSKMTPIENKVKSFGSEYPRTSDYIKLHTFVSVVEKTINNIQENYSSNSVKREAIREAKKIKEWCLDEKEGGLYYQVKYELRFEKAEVKFDEIAEQIEKQQQIADDVLQNEEARLNATQFIIDNGDKMEECDNEMTNAQTQWEEWKDSTLQPKFDRLDYLAEICNACERIDNKTRSRFARREYRAVKKDLRKFYKEQFGKGWKKIWKTKKIELKNAKFEITRGKYQTFLSKLGYITAKGGLLPARNIVTLFLATNIGGISTKLEEVYNLAESGNSNAKTQLDRILNKWYSLGGNKEKFIKRVQKYGKATPVIEDMDDVDEDTFADVMQSNGYDLNEIAKSSAEYGADGTIMNGTAYYNLLGIDDAVWVEITTALSCISGIWGLIQSVLGSFGGSGKVGTPFSSDEGVTGSNDAMNLLLFQSAVQGGVLSVSEEEASKIEELILNGTDWTSAVVQVHGGEFYYDGNGELCYKEPISNAVVGMGIALGVVAIGGIIWAIKSK